MLEKKETLDKVGARPIAGYEGLYSVTASGRVWSHKKSTTSTGQFLKGGDNGRGYRFVFLYKNGTPKRFYVHRLVAEAFIENTDCLPQVNHIDGNKNNNCKDNLEWASRSMNMRHAWDAGLCKPEDKQKEAAKRNAKRRRLFNDSDVIDIRFLHSQGCSKSKLAKEYGVTTGAILQIVNYKSYKEVA